ncbi:hypothetical protein PV328_011150 [Microctonus aethiopoides]|uniref:Uncharacterized protein n=1 Tax=Microctonus aethiopoides TaxID=144406 RepID=A0AA39C3T8_9HYME|nr:hypothetical protein PV328_011150 [Microctonus aethiopoides]
MITQFFKIFFPLPKVNIKSNIPDESHGRAICVDQETGLLANLENPTELPIPVVKNSEAQYSIVSQILNNCALYINN